LQRPANAGTDDGHHGARSVANQESSDGHWDSLEKYIVEQDGPRHACAHSSFDGHAGQGGLGIGPVTGARMVARQSSRCDQFKPDVRSADSVVR